MKRGRLDNQSLIISCPQRPMLYGKVGASPKWKNMDQNGKDSLPREEPFKGV